MIYGKVGRSASVNKDVRYVTNTGWAKKVSCCIVDCKFVNYGPV